MNLYLMQGTTMYSSTQIAHGGLEVYHLVEYCLHT